MIVFVDLQERGKELSFEEWSERGSLFSSSGYNIERIGKTADNSLFLIGVLKVVSEGGFNLRKEKSGFFFTIVLIYS